MNSGIENYSIRRLMRTMVVMVVYEYELLSENIVANKIFQDDKFNDLFDYKKIRIKNKNQFLNEQLQIILTIEKNYDTFKKMIIKHIRNDWSWSRLDPLIRSMLLCASVELWKLDIGIVTNEYVEIAKDFIPDNESYKFINIIIEKIGREYHEFKQKRNQTN